MNTTVLEMSSLFDKNLERANRNHYITGTPALNFPTGKNTGGWHFVSFFDLDNDVYKVSLSGIHYPETTKYFGDNGVIDISDKLDQLKIPLPKEPVFIADHYRAAADMIVKWALSGRTHCSVEVDEWFPSEQAKKKLYKSINLAKQKLQKDGIWTRIESWMKSQKELEKKEIRPEESIFH